MSKKHYTEVARIIAGERRELDAERDGRIEQHMEGCESMRRTLARELASFFKRDNGNFDRSRVLAACDVPEGN